MSEKPVISAPGTSPPAGGSDQRRKSSIRLLTSPRDASPPTKHVRKSTVQMGKSMPGDETPRVVNHLRKTSVQVQDSPATAQNRKSSVVISSEDLKKQTTVPTEIPGEMKRKEAPVRSGEGRKNLRNLIGKQLEMNREQKSFDEEVKTNIYKEEELKKERQDRIVDVFLKEPDPVVKEARPDPVRKKKPKNRKGPSLEDANQRGNLGYFLTDSNFKKPKTLTREKSKISMSTYNAIDSRLKSSQVDLKGNTFGDVFLTGMSSSTSGSKIAPRLNAKPRLPANKSYKMNKTMSKFDTTLLPYPQEVSKSEHRLNFGDVWKRADTNDIFPYASSFRIHDEDNPVPFPFNDMQDNEDPRTEENTLNMTTNTGFSDLSAINSTMKNTITRRMSSWTCVPQETTKTVTEMLEEGLSFNHARKTVYNPNFTERFGVRKEELFAVSLEEEVGLKEEFRARYNAVLDTLQIESDKKPQPSKVGDIPPLGEMDLKSEIFRTESEKENDDDGDEIKVENFGINEDGSQDEGVGTQQLKEVDAKRRARCHSPRGSLIRESVSRGLIPFRIRELLDTEDTECVEVIDLKGQGLGDDKMCSVVQTLPYFSSVVELNVCDNRLTDDSIEPLLNMVLFTLENVKVIDLSANKMDQVSVDMLNNYLSSSTCKLRELRLNKSDVDDLECANMMKSMTENKSIKKLFLSNNFIGVNEELNAVTPEFVTGPEAIASMLMQNDVLVELDVSWNSIRGESAITLGQAITTNNHLISLNLSYNSIGDAGAQQLAHSLRFNASLKFLDVSFNHLGPKTALVFSQVIDTTDVLQMLNMNGNCPGLIGGRALLRSIRMKALAKKTLIVKLDKANLNYIDDTFDRQNPSGEYEYDMSSPYGYAVVCILFEMASTKPDARFLHVMHSETVTKKVSKGLDNSKNSDDLVGKREKNINWSKVNLYRGPSDNDKANNMWKKLIEDLVVTQESREKAALSKEEMKERNNLKERLFGAGSLKNTSNLLIKSKRSKVTSEKKENTKDFFALEKICMNFDLFPEDGPLEKIAAHFSRLPANSKNTLPKIVKQLFVVAFQVAENYQTNDFRLAVLQAKASHEKKELKASGGDAMCDVSDIVKVLTLLGWKQMTPTKYQFVGEKILKSLDIFGRGVVCQADFIRLMFLQFTDNYAQAPGPLLDAATGMVWEVPTSGHLQIKFHATSMPPSKEALVSEETIKIMTGSEYVASLHVTTEDKERHLRHSTTANRFRQYVPVPRKAKASDKVSKMATIDEDFAVTAEQADMLLAEVMRTNETPLTHAVESILPQVATPIDACRFLASNLTFEQLMVTRDRMVNAFRTVSGICGGHYVIDLSSKYDRAAMKKLGAFSNLEKAKRFGGDIPYLNTSQSGNNESFRNCFVNGKPRTLTSAWTEDMPQAGKLRFDYVNTERTVEGVEPVTDHMFQRILDEILFCDEYQVRLEKEETEKKLKLAKKKSISKKKKEFSPPKFRRARSASTIDVEKELGEEEDKLRNQRLTGRKPPILRPNARGTKSFDMFTNAASDDSEDTESISTSSNPQKRLAIIAKRRRMSSRVGTQEDKLRFFKAVKGEVSLARRRQLNFEYSAVWGEVEITSFESYMKAYKLYLEKRLQAAKDQILAKRDLITNNSESTAEDNDEKQKTIEDIQAQNELKFLHQIALYHLTYRLGRIRPYFLSDVFSMKKIIQAEESVKQAPDPPPKSNTPKLTYRQRKKLKSKKRELIEDAIKVSKEISVAEKCVPFHDFMRACEVCLVYQVYFSAKQASIIVDRLMKKNAPNLVIVNLIQMIFSRIIDIANFSYFVSLYPADLRDELFHRIGIDIYSTQTIMPYINSFGDADVGILNVWTPLYPDMTYRLNLSAWDNREAAKMLFKLAEIEPGENLIGETYRPSLIEDNIPGWELPMPWTLEGSGAENMSNEPCPYRGDDDFNPLLDCTLDQREGTGCRRHGVICFEYTSDPKKGCRAHVESRIEMMKHRTLGAYKGIFTNDLANLNQPKKRIKQQRAVKIVGMKLKRLASVARQKVADKNAENSDSDSSSGEARRRRTITNKVSKLLFS